VSVDLKTVDSLSQAITFHRERHTVLAGNIANLDTPGFRPFDLSRATSEGAGTMATTSSGHIQTSASAQTHTIQSFDDGGAMQGADGNAVSLERELGKIDANRARYATATELVSRRLALLRYAAGDGT
jgi:flagellar basal-body rod protein FlgB